MARRVTPLYRRVQIEQNAKNIRLTEAQLNAVKEWASRLESGSLRSESENYTGFQRYILQDLLGYENSRHQLDNIDFVVPAVNGDGHTLVIECKGANTGLDQRQHRENKAHRTPMSQLWDYMERGEWGIVTNYRLFRLVRRSRGGGSAQEIDFQTLYDEDGPDLARVAEFVYVFDHIVRSGDDALDIDTGTEDREMTNRFYRLFSETRLMLVREFEEGGATRNDAIHKAQIFLNRLVFLFFAEDRNMVRNGLFMSQLRGCLDTGFPDDCTDAVCRGIRDGLFRALDGGYGHRIPKFNGGLFREGTVSDVSFRDYRNGEWFAGAVPDPARVSSSHAKKYAKTHPRLSPIILNMVEMRQYSFQSDIDLNILGHVFERSIQDLDDLEAGSVRKSEGIYYTPSYITDWICRNTILPYLSLSGTVLEPEDLVREYAECGRLAELEKRLRDLRVLDPACGSGAFITAAAAVLLELHEAIHDSRILNRDYLSSSGQARLDEWSADTIMRRIITDNIYGVDKNPQAVRIAQLSLFLLVASSENPLPDNSSHIISGNSIISDSSVVQNAVQWNDAFPEVFGPDSAGFDIIVGNPPYGAKLTADEKKYLKDEFDAGGSNTAAIFTHQSLRLLKKDGMHGFIVPKSLMFSSKEWVKAREAILDGLVVLVDVGKVWNEVKLEQCIYVVRKGSGTTNYSSSVRANDTVNVATNVDKSLVSLFGAFPSVASEAEMSLGNKLANNSQFLKVYVDNTRGSTVRSDHIKDIGTPVVGGKQIQPYRVVGIKGRVDPAAVGENAIVGKNAILAQNIVAHIENPVDRIRITATMPERDDFLILDTVNQLTVKGVSPYFVLGLLSSKIANWYAYRFIFSKSIRTMHFDNAVTNRIPIKVSRESEAVRCVQAILACHNRDGNGDSETHAEVEKLVSKLDNMFYDIFGLTAGEIRMVEASFGDNQRPEPAA